jgi:trehalose-6-phosphate synthase
VNPMHTEQVAASIDSALRMSTTTKRLRHQQLSRYVNTYTSTLWAQRIMSALNEVRLGTIAAQLEYSLT